MLFRSIKNHPQNLQLGTHSNDTLPKNKVAKRGLKVLDMLTMRAFDFLGFRIIFHLEHQSFMRDKSEFMVSKSAVRAAGLGTIATRDESSAYANKLFQIGNS